MQQGDRMKTNSKYNDPIFLEESKQLKNCITDILCEIGSYVVSQDELKAAKADYDKLNKTIVQHLYAIAKILDPLKSQVETYRDMLDVPYHGRVVLEHVEDNGETVKENFYIGKGLFKSDDYCIINWTLPVAKAFYERNASTIVDEAGVVNQLLLRRRLLIEGQELKDYADIYTQDVAGNKIVDPFLIKILNDKRRQNVTTDIVETIQDEQYKIISEPISKQFIVQGCAGSGKTMVLLHRLAYLIDNNPQLEPNNYLILTPNNFFDEHIDEVTKDLKIKSVKRATVEEYYVELLDAYDHKLKPNEVKSDRVLPVSLLKDVYSIRSLTEVRKSYDMYWNRIFADAKVNFLIQKSCPEVFSTEEPKIDIAKDIKSKFTVHTAEYIKSKAIVFIKEQKENDGKYRTLLEQLHNASVRYENKNQLIAEREGLVSAAKSQIVKVIDNEILRIRAEQPSVETQIRELEIVVAELGAKIKETIATLNEIGEKRRRYEAKVRGFYARSNKVIKDQTLLKYKRDEETLNAFLLEKSREKVIKNNELEQLKKVGGQQVDDEAIAVLEKAKAILTKRPISRLVRSDLGIKESLIDAEIQEYNKYADGYSSFIRNFDITKANIENYQKEITKIKETRVTQEELKGLEEALKEFSKQCELKVVLKETVLKCLSNIFAGHGLEYSDSDYRCVLPLKLAFCKLFFDRRIGKHMMVSIDEAQDLGYLEYKVLFNVMPANLYINLYGDTDQLIYDYKGLSTWQNIIEYYSGIQTYELNQNYRNTEQITDYVNEKLGKEFQAIGIHGKPVYHVTFENGVKQAIEKLHINKRRRVAIVYDTELPWKKKDILNWLERYDSTTEKLHRLVKVMSVEEVKGMEFDSVVVFTENMTDNEKYVAFTRALDYLYIVK